MRSGNSFTWQSILAGLECFKLGYIWRVGECTQINIWNDNWIPSSHNMKVLTPRGNILVSTVDKLINPINGRWDEELIRSLFWSVDVHRILQIPIAPVREDLIAWQFNRNGLFSVKSAYHCQWSHSFGNNVQHVVASGSGATPVWWQLWNLALPSKIKIFAWRVLHGCISCFVILANKHIMNSGTCPMCQSDAEDIRHALFACSRAREVWSALGIWQQIQALMAEDRSGSVVLQEAIRREG